MPSTPQLTPKERALLRSLLRALLTEQTNADILYIPRGEAGMRRMIRALLAIRPKVQESDPLAGPIDAFYALESKQAQKGED